MVLCAGAARHSPLLTSVTVKQKKETNLASFYGTAASRGSVVLPKAVVCLLH